MPQARWARQLKRQHMGNAQMPAKAAQAIREGKMSTNRTFQKLARSSFMQLLGQVSAPIIAGIALLLLNEVWSMTKGFVKMESNIQALTTIVTATNVDRYTGTQAANDKSFLQSQINDLKVRQDTAEQRTRATTFRAQVVRPK